MMDKGGAGRGSFMRNTIWGCRGSLSGVPSASSIMGAVKAVAAVACARAVTRAVPRR